MSELIYIRKVKERSGKPIVWLADKVKSPPFSSGARVEAGTLLRCLQSGLKLSLPHSRPMPGIGPRCHELRIKDINSDWRIFYRLDDDAIVLLNIELKKTRETPISVIELCKKRAKQYDQEVL